MSDRWLGVLAKSWKADNWGLDSSTIKMASEMSFTCFAISGDPRNIRNEEVRFKLFYHLDDNPGYAEWFLHVNIPAVYVGFSDKDHT